MVNNGIVSFLQGYIKQVTCMRLNQYCRQTSFMIHDLEQPNDPNLLREEMSIIKLWGSIGAVTLKLHFDMKVATNLAAHTFQKSENQVAPQVAREFCTEVSNMQASYIRGILERNEIYFGMSLPFLAAGEDEIIFRKIRDPRSNFSVWKMCTGEGTNELICSSELLLFDSSPIERIRSVMEAELAKESKKDTSATGEVVFL